MKKRMPIVRPAILLLILLTVLCTCVLAADSTASTPVEFYDALLRHMKNQDGEFSIEYTGEGTDWMPLDQGELSFPFLLRGMTANLPNPDGTGPDTHMLNVTEGVCRQENKTVYFGISYLQSPEQISWVEREAEQIVSALQLDGLSDYMKIKKIYQYMGTNFTYDYELKKFSDYEGITTGSMVCQGYALLTYRLMWKAQIPCRIMVGVSNGESHGWNLVKLEGKWYHLDTTWDAGEGDGRMYWNYFLRGENDFAYHLTDERYYVDIFRNGQPVSEESYAAPAVEILIDGTIYSSLIIRNGKSTQLEAVLTPESATPIRWSSTDESVVSVDQTGNITSLTPGEVYIKAETDDPAYIAATFPVTAVELRTCSAWADAELNSFYLRKLYPAALCSDYQSPITRAEFSNLLYQMLATYYNVGGNYETPKFEDIKDSDYWFSIIYTSCRGLFQGMSETSFCPDAPLTREQAVKTIVAMLDFMELQLPNDPAQSFRDSESISLWARGYVARAAAAGILQGVGEELLPQESVTREQAAVMLERVVVNLIEPLLPEKEAA